MAPPNAVDILRHIAREEPLTGTVRAFPGLTREDVGRLIEAAAERLASLEPPAPPPEATPAPEVATGQEEARPRLRLFSDGAARGNPGPAGAGAVLVDPEGKVVARLGKFLGTQTNNYAEYMGLLLGLRYARSVGTRELEVLADSELLVRQLEGRYQVKSPTLRPLYEEASRLLKGFSQVKLQHIP
ncbi:MAG TPA: ribonuclease HI family protein, partial [Myxococcaceae bacterium]|nr:ribonuclease HI family protein [Myxococcaceae bacterium]